MDTKLTLRLNKGVIDRAKAYAHDRNTSLSRMIESYLESITSQNVSTTEISPLVESLSGVVELDENFDFKKEYSSYLTKKYR
jgi:hypothetical protein